MASLGHNELKTPIPDPQNDVITRGPLVTSGFASQGPVTRSFDVNGWVNNRDAGDLRLHRAHYDVSVMILANTSHMYCTMMTHLGSCLKIQTLDKMDAILADDIFKCIFLNGNIRIAI